MKKLNYFYTEGDHKWASISNDPERQPFLIDTNEYVLIHNNKILLMDPGGMEVFPAVFSCIANELEPREIEYIFASHQDPDIISSLALWLEVVPNIKVFTSYLWSSFIPHFGGTGDIFISLDDTEQNFDFNGLELVFIPAHYLHSSGNYNLFDPKAKILFSGDIGAALLPSNAGEEQSIYVKNFDEHIKYATGFHKRWMPSNEAKLDWCERVSKYDIEFLCPQHGLIYQGKDVERFINWFSELKVGITKNSPQ